MNPSARRSIRLLAVAGTMILTLGASSMNLTGLRGGLEVQGVSVQDGGVAVAVANLSSRTLSGTIVLQSITTLEVLAAIPVTIPGGGRATVFAAVPVPTGDGLTVGVVLDDGAPF